MQVSTLHEWILAEGVVEIIIRKTKELNTNKLNLVRIVFGKLQQVDREIFRYALEELLNSIVKELGIEIKSIVFDEENIVLKCNRCGYEWKLDLDNLPEYDRESIHFVPETIHAYVLCPSCRSHDYEIISGRGVSVEIW